MIKLYSLIFTWLAARAFQYIDPLPLLPKAGLSLHTPAQSTHEMFRQDES